MTTGADDESALIRCTRCLLPYPVEGFPFVCPQCGGIFDFPDLPDYKVDTTTAREKQAAPGIWRYRESFGLPDSAPVISLGEGNTPLISASFGNKTIWLKLESLNPTGSYKDRGSAVLLSVLASRGIQRAVEDSSGNAGASFAAYAARAGIRARVFVPETASGPKRGQIEAYGAELVGVPGPRSAAAEAVLAEARSGAAYASHAYAPFGLAGIATISYELWKQVGWVPGTVIAPVGHGGLLLGIMRGFAALVAAKKIEQPPYYVGVQARACGPIWEAFAGKQQAVGVITEGQTVAEGVRVTSPVRGDAILRVMQAGGGRMLAVAEEDILPAFAQLARAGFHVEPTSALVWAVLKHNLEFFPEPVVLILSGAGLKYRTTTS
jgi:threonine synthase